MNTDSCSGAAEMSAANVSNEGAHYDNSLSSLNDRAPRRRRSSLRSGLKNGDANHSRRSVTFGVSDRSLNSFASSLDPDLDLDQGSFNTREDSSFNTRDDNGILIDGDEHINDVLILHAQLLRSHVRQNQLPVKPDKKTI